MNLNEEDIEHFWQEGYVLKENFLDQESLTRAQTAMWDIFPKPEAYFSDPEAHVRYARSQFAGLKLFPFPSWEINRLAVYPALVDAARRICATDELHLYKIELWGKYSGAINYDQPHHYDYGNHSLVVPQESSRHVQMTCFILLSDVTEVDGPTRLIPKSRSGDIPLVPRELQMGALREREISVTGPAGSLLVYRTDVLHRGSDFGAPGRSRFAMLIDFQPRGLPWIGKMAWPNHSLSPYWVEAMEKMTPVERTMFGFPAIGDPYWDAQTRRDVSKRYPAMDMTPYKEVG